MFLKHKNFFKISKKILNHKPKEMVERINLHENTSDKDQLMIIWQKRNYLHKPKKFLDSHKIFLCLKGKLKIYILSNSGKITNSFTLDDQINNFCRIKKNVMCADIPITNFALHCEITNHSFLKRKIKYISDKAFQTFKNKI